MLMRRGLNVWIEYTLDWALYDGYLEERGTTTVELRVSSTPVTASPTSPVRFDTIFFQGAEPGMTLTLDKECSMRPLFSGRPGYDELLEFGDVARHEVRQMELLQAVGHLFNLRFFTEEPSRRVWIEPADDFYGAGPMPTGARGPTSRSRSSSRSSRPDSTSGARGATPPPRGPWPEPTRSRTRSSAPGATR